MTDGRSKTRWGGVVPAAGQGLRMKGAEPKQLLTLGDRPVLIHTLQRLTACPELETVVVAVPNDLTRLVAELVCRFGLKKVLAVVPGGETRQESVARALTALDSALDYVVVHDGVRPFVDLPTITRVMTAARQVGAATAGIPVHDTLAGVNRKSLISSMPSRARMWQVQTPQAFWRRLLEEAQAKAAEDDHVGTDEAGLLVRLGHRVKMVEGSPLNLKLTTPHDLEMARACLGLNLLETSA